MKYSILAICCCLLYRNMQAQTSDSISVKLFENLIITPIVTYKPETSWGFGAGAVYLFTPRNHYMKNTPGYSADSLIISQTNTSLLTAIAGFTLKKQIQADFGGNIYTRGNNYLLYFNVAYYKYPASFFGIGNHTLSTDEERYTNTHPFVKLHLLKRMTDHFYAGGKYFFEHSSIAVSDSSKTLATQEIPGEDGGFVSGIGPWLKYDTRDNINYPSQGVHADASSLFFTNHLGSTYAYIDNTLEVSYFSRAFYNHVLALHCYGKFQSGTPPFNRMAELGGAFRMRGNYEGRFRDKNYITIQAEYRVPVGNFLAFHAFGGAGEVADTLQGFSLNGLKYSMGGGVRFFVIAKDKLSLRIDYALGSKSILDTGGSLTYDSGLYITIGEAF